jgi:ABC-type taurine transport system substrate-binding protein
MNMVNALEDLLGQSNFGLLDELLASVDYGEISPEVMVAFVRTTYQARSKLRAWPSAVQKIRNELTLRGFDGSRVLTGLLS